MNENGRIGSLDILRGMALLGMFIVHFHVRTLEATELDELIRTLVWRLVESKSHGTFALLFGAGFAIQLRRAEERGADMRAAIDSVIDKMNRQIRRFHERRVRRSRREAVNLGVLAAEQSNALADAITEEADTTAAE